MSTDDLVSAVILKATGDLSTASFGDDDYKKVVQRANIHIDSWAKEDEWNSLYDSAVDIGTITATDTYDLDSSIRVISTHPDDYIQIITTDGRTINYETVQASDLKRYNTGKYCARIGSTLKFNKVFDTTDPEYGGSIKVPAFLYANHLSKAKDTIPVDDPNWLVAMGAADWVQLDVTLSQYRSDFLAEATDLLAAMKKANAAQVDTLTLKQVTPDLRNW